MRSRWVSGGVERTVREVVMAQNQDAPAMQPPGQDPALKRLERLAGSPAAPQRRPTSRESKMRRRWLLAWLTGLALSAALLAPATAFATETTTIHFSGTDSRASANPC